MQFAGLSRRALGWIVFFGVIAVGIVMVVVTRAAQAQAESDFRPFIGEYSGHVMLETPSGPARRDLDVVVRAEGEGFSLEWTTDTEYADGRFKSDTYFIAFRPTQRPGFYLPTNMVRRGNDVVRMDPLNGDPQLLLCKIEGKTMTVHASQLMEDGVFEVQTYERTLTPGGMHLKFTRVRNGTELRDIEVDLTLK